MIQKCRYCHYATYACQLAEFRCGGCGKKLTRQDLNEKNNCPYYREGERDVVIAAQIMEEKRRRDQ